MKNITAVLVLLFVLAGVVWVVFGFAKPSEPIVTVSPTSTPPVVPGDNRPEPPAPANPGKTPSAGISLGEKRTFSSITVEPKRVVEDSRCPADAMCVWQGQARVETALSSGGNTSLVTLTLGTKYSFAGYSVTLTQVDPYPLASQPTDPKDYRFTYSVVKEVVTTPPSQGACYIGGCSSQICSDTPDMVSTCEWREEYQCYKGEKCERQANGECGWTPSTSLTECLARN